MSEVKFENDCTKKCHLMEHANKITSSLTKRNVDQSILAAYIAKVCQNFAGIQDCLGRTALHVTVSVDKYALCEWLLNQGASLNIKDNESGSTPLHRALFYGCIDCAVLLIRYGANLDILDNDTFLPFQNICRMQEICYNIPSLNEMLVWGSNKNYNLGIGNNDHAKAPQFIDLFRKDNISISQAAISQYHSLFLDKKGNLFAVGSGMKGRLGINSENNLAVPKRVTKLNIKNSEEKIISISISKCHSMILTSRGFVHVCGSNEHKQLGLKPSPEILLTFKEVPAFQQCGITGIIGIFANDFYSLAHSKAEVYVWGTNLGQFGNTENNEEILLPKQIQIPDGKSVEHIATSHNGIAIATSGKHIFLYFNHKIKAIKPPVLEGVKSLSLITTDLQTKNKTPTKEKSLPSLRLLLLSDTNVVYIWYEDVQQYLRCSFTQFRLPVIDKLYFKHNQIFLLSQGDVYLGKCSKVPISNIIKESETAWLSSAQSRKEINCDYKIRIDLNRIEGIDRAVDIFCDDNLESFAILQEHSRKYYKLPSLTLEEYNFKQLLNDVNEMDTVHDIVFHVDGDIFPAHKFIIYSRSKGLKSIIEKFTDKDIYLSYKHFTGKMFEIILKFIYSNYLLTLDDISDIEQSLVPEGLEKSAMKIFIDISEKFLLNDLVLHAKSLLQSLNIKSNNQKSFDKSKSRFNRVRRSNLPELHDVTIICSNNQQIKAHKCVLVTRLEYFNLMFTHSWSETSTINLTTIPIEYMEPIVDFLYTFDFDSFKKQNYNETFLYNMIVICDQFFINQLRKACEILVLEKISIRKCGEMLEFAESYNCEILKAGCMDFICQNLARILYQKSLEVCEPITLKNLNNHYRKIFQNIFDFRQITPDSECISDEELLLIVGDSKIDLDYKYDNTSGSSNKIIKKIKTKEEKFKVDRRNYEKDAITTKFKELHLENQQLVLNKEKDLLNNKTKNIIEECAKINNEISSSQSSWTKVNEKKEPKKKSIPGSTKLNDLLKEEEKPKENFVSLNKIAKSPSTSSSSNLFSKSFENNSQQQQRKRTESITEENDSSSRHSFNLGDITPSKNEKLSQKQRKRLSSTSSTINQAFETLTSQIESPKTKPVSIPLAQPNAWGIIKSPSSSGNELDLSASFGKVIKSTPDKIKTSSGSNSSSYDTCSSSFGNIKKISTSNGISNNLTSPQSSKLTQILEDEKRQKQYIDHIKSKSLVLTQIEEKAIAELRVFYNADNCEDEIITIARKPMNINCYSLPTWQKH